MNSPEPFSSGCCLDVNFAPDAHLVFGISSVPSRSVLIAHSSICLQAWEAALLRLENRMYFIEIQEKKGTHRCSPSSCVCAVLCLAPVLCLLQTELLLDSVPLFCGLFPSWSLGAAPDSLKSPANCSS